MIHPVFISVASEDVRFAKKVSAAFPEDLVYFYERTGTEGENWPLEIEEEVRGCECFVILWSRNYVNKEWSRREMALAARRVKNGELGVWVIIQLDDLPLEAKCVNPLSGREEDMLSPFRAKYRSVALPFRAQTAKKAIGNALARVRPTRLPRLPRAELQEQLRRSISVDYRNRIGLLFISGLYGNGRKTLIEMVMESDYPHLTGYVIALDAADGPEDLLMRIWVDVLAVGVSEAHRRFDVAGGDQFKIKTMLKGAVKDIAQIKSYIVVTFEIPSENLNSIPAWLRDAFGELSSGLAPSVFAVSPRRVPDSYIAGFASAQSIFITTLDDRESRELVWRLAQALDDRPARWDDRHVGLVAQAGGGSPELIKDLVVLAARERTFDFIEQQIAPVIERFSEYISGWVTAALSNLGERAPNGLLVLKIIDRLGIADLQALKEVLGLKIKSIGAMLYELRDFGLVEQLNDGVYRIPPLLRARLNVHLATKELRDISDECLLTLSRRTLSMQDEYGATYIVNALSSKLTQGAFISDEEARFVSVAMIFRTGLQSYRLGEYPTAYRLLRRAFDQQANVRDEDARIEIARYYGLASIRENHPWEDVKTELSTRFIGSRFDSKAKSIVHFLAGFSARLDGEFDVACAELDVAYALASDGPWARRQRAIILNEWVRSHLHVNHPDYTLAVSRAREACEINLTPFTQDALVRALIMRTYREEDLAEDEVDRGFDDIDTELAILERKCEQTGLHFHRLRKVDLREYEAFENNKDSDGKQLNLAKAIRAAREAYEHDRRHDTLVRIWQLTYDNEDGQNWSGLRQEVRAFLDENRHASNRHRGHAAYYLIAATDVSTATGKQEANRLLRQYRNLLPRRNIDELRGYITTGVLRGYVPGSFDGWIELSQSDQ